MNLTIQILINSTVLTQIIIIFVLWKRVNSMENLLAKIIK